MILTLGLSVGVYAQNLGTAVTCPGIQPLDCTTNADPLHPVPGVAYDYQVEVTPQGGQFNWFVTTDPNFMANGAITSNIEQAGGNIVLATGTGYNDPTSTNATQSITWKAEPEAGKDLFLVLHYTDATNCNADNLKVYKIEMRNNFAIDVYTVAAATSATTLGDNASTESVCSPKMQSAKYENGEVVYDYGITYLYYVIAAGNFVKDWDLQFKLETTLDPKQTVAVDWSENGTADWNPLTENSGVYSTKVTGEDGFNENDCIVVRVAITNSTYEVLTDQTVKLLADATSNGKNDVKSDCSGDAADFEKQAMQTITARPTVTNQTAGGDFVPAK